MATGAQQSSTNQDPIAAAQRAGEPPATRRYRLTPGPVTDIKRPGMLGGSASGGAGDQGRSNVSALGIDLQAIAPHTGF